MKKSVRNTLIGTLLLGLGYAGYMANPDNPRITAKSIVLTDNIYKAVIGEDLDIVEIGERNSVNFKPKMKFNRWDKECSLTFEYITGKLNSPILRDNKITSVNKNETIDIYKIDDDNLEFEITLNQVSSKNKFVFQITGHEDYYFCHQPAFKNYKEIEINGEIYYEKTDEPKKGMRHKPNIQNSIAVYHKTKEHNKYKTGKFGHIYAPKAIGANGDEKYGTARKIDDKLIFEIDNEWLQKAKYPVKIDPQLGTTSIGGDTYASWEFDGQEHTAIEDGTVTSIKMYLSGCNTEDINFGYYNDSSGVGTNVAHGTAIDGDSQGVGWKEIVVSGSITNGNTYWIIGQQQIGGTSSDRCDNFSGLHESEMDSFTWNNWADSPNMEYYNYKISIYMEYTASGGNGGEEEGFIPTFILN